MSTIYKELLKSSSKKKVQLRSGQNIGTHTLLKKNTQMENLWHCSTSYVVRKFQIMTTTRTFESILITRIAKISNNI